MGIIYDLNQGKLVQNSLVGKINSEDEFAEMAKRLGGKEIKLEQGENFTINPFEPMYEVYGESKNEFVKGLSSLVPVDIIETNEEFIRILLKVYLMTDEERYTFEDNYIKLLKSLSGSMQFVKL